MIGSNLLLDTNVVLYFLSGDDTLVPLLGEKNIMISVITEMEILSYSLLKGKELSETKKFLNTCTVINLNKDIKEKAIAIRRKYKMNLPDCIIMATSMSLDIPLITADQDFKKIKEGNIILYEDN
ncbi:MAG: type II toxin-antitoxin system VapC family toxin [Balneolaceae bacterium]